MKDKRVETRKCIEIEESKEYHFKWQDTNYGQAWFIFCPIWKRGKIQEVFIYPRAQKVDYFYHANLYGRNDFSVQSWVGLDHPYTWIHGWCKEHKCSNFGVYVPNNSKWFQLSCGGIYFGRDKS